MNSVAPGFNFGAACSVCVGSGGGGECPSCVPVDGTVLEDISTSGAVTVSVSVAWTAESFPVSAGTGSSTVGVVGSGVVIVRSVVTRLRIDAARDERYLSRHVARFLDFRAKERRQCD